MASEKIPYFNWREGRPRWIPGPEVRALDFKGTDLKDAQGRWLKRADAIDAAERLNAAVAAKRSGTPPPKVMLLGATQLVREMVDAFLARPKLSLDNHIAERAAGAGRRKKVLHRSTRLAYHAHGELLKEWAGDMPAADVTPAMCEEFYADRIADSSVATANAIMRSFSSFFIYAEDKLRWKGVRNPVKGLELDACEGRLVIWPLAEISCFVAAADYLGWPSIGDAVVEALLTCARRNDVLTMPRLPLDSNEGIYRFKANKTGRDVTVKAVPSLVDRVRIMRARNPVGGFEIICDATGLPYPADGSYFAKRFDAVRLIAAGGNGNNAAMAQAIGLLKVTDAHVAAMPGIRMPSLLGLWFRDLRDTGITWLAAAGCDRYEIATATGLSLVSVDSVLDKHYLVRHDGFAISAGDKLAAYMNRSA